ncbi:MAG: hypothetical protein J6J42_13845 [Lachnospiraceae bacterium]|nr:hypothetical protein [Lachnospiraceae bacterium]
MSTINRQYKDRLFRLLFADEQNKSNALALYNALNHSSYTNEDDLEFNTLENVLYLGMKNDLSFIIADTMSLYEQQASHNPNMPLRGFLYFSKLYDKYLAHHQKSLHSRTLITVPTPRYMVFYNGMEHRPAVEKLRLSEAFEKPDTSGEFEWTATVINLNHEANSALLNSCRPLYEYTTLVSRIQYYRAQNLPIETAVNTAVDDCIREGILVNFLTEHRTEVLQLYLEELDEKFYLEELWEEGRKEGLQIHLTQLILKKIKTGKSLEQIAAEVEEKPEDIRALYEELVAAGR